MDKLLKFNNKLIKSGNRIVCKKDTVDPYNPLNLPANTVRVRTTDGNPPGKFAASYETATLVPGTTDVYDVYKSGTSFRYLFWQSTNLLEVLGANTTGITDMRDAFHGCFSVTTIPLFDTRNVTTMYFMCYQCKALTSIPLFDTSKVTNMQCTFEVCHSVESGALALYQQVSTQTTPPSNHVSTFRGCGSNTQTGAAELAQIPDDWK
jgi:surface protein